MLLKLNTKAVGLAGFGLFILSLLMYGPFQSAISGLVGPKVQPYLALVFLVAGFLASYLGMPTTVPEKPKSGS